MALAAHPALVAGESLKRPDESKLSSVRFLLSPLVVLRTPCADLRSACRGSDSWVQESCMAVGNRFNGTGNGRLLLKEKPFGECTHQLSLPATSDFCPNHAPVAADSAAGREGVRSTTMGESRKRTEESLLSSGRFRLSPATGAGRQCRLPVLLT